MKNYFIAFAAVLLFTASSCKKNNPSQQPPVEKRWVVTTIAGTGTASFVNGPALSATFHFPEDVGITANGMYVTDVLNFCVRKIAGGQVSTFAGGGSSDIVNGNGAAARFRNPFNIASDGNGNLYTTDENDPRIRKITPAGDVSTHAGTAIAGFADGNANTAQFSPGNYITADAQGNIYVSDVLNHRIRKVSINGQVSTIAGTGVAGFNDGEAGAAQFSLPGGIAIDNQGNLYIADRLNFRIRKITPGGTVSTLSGSGQMGNKDGNPNEAQFSLDMHDMTIDNDGNLYLADEHRIRKITAQGVVSTIAGSTAGFVDAEGPQAKFDFIAGITVDASGKLYVADLSNNRIRRISLE